MRRFAWFDSLRCLAVLLVILAHAGNVFTAWPYLLAHLAGDLQLMSWVGVDLFFVLSGFLVSGLLFDEHDASGTLKIGRFLVRRAFKIIPPFYVLLLATVLVDAVFRGRVVWVHLFHDVFFLQSYREGAWPHAWTLAVEVHFYLLLALLLAFLARRPPRDGRWLARLPAILSGVIVFCFAARLVNSSFRHSFNFHREIQATHLHLDVLAAGVLLRYFYSYHPARLDFLRRGPLLWAALGVLLVLPSEFCWRPHPAIVTALIPTLNAFGFSLILFEATQLAFPVAGFRHALVRPFDYLGKHSYSIYLWHLPVKDWLVDPLLKERGLFYLFAFGGFSLGVGCLFSVALEMPVLHLRNRLFPSVTSRTSIPPTPATIVEPPPEEIPSA
jgi:peptidoglycan/LPS O-acetylase OafA/YrhL